MTYMMGMAPIPADPGVGVPVARWPGVDGVRRPGRRGRGLSRRRPKSIFIWAVVVREHVSNVCMHKCVCVCVCMRVYVCVCVCMCVCVVCVM